MKRFPISGPRLLGSLFLLLVIAAGIDSSAVQQGVEPDTTRASGTSLDSLSAKMSRSKLTHWLSDYIFVRPSENDTARMIESPVVSGVSYFIPYRGKIIRDIRILRLPVFSAESGMTGGVLEVGNRIHVDTRTRVVEGYLLMSPGEPLDPWSLADTERILRGAPFIQDATIVVVPVRENPDSADVLVVTQDVWSIGATGSMRSKNNYSLKLFERNFLGLGQILEAEYDVDRGRAQEVDYGGLYRIENIRGTFVSGEFRYANSHRENRSQIAFSRPFRTVEFKYGGAAALGYIQEKDASASVVRSYDLADLWMGRAFTLGGSRRPPAERTRLTLSGRVTAKTFTKREPVTEESIRSLHDANLFLTGVSLSRVEFKKTFMIRSYGRTEDLGSGYLVGLTGGFEDGEFNNRLYSGLKISSGASERFLGYYAWVAELGGFFRHRDFQDGSARLAVSAFTPLSRPGPYRYRHLIDFGYQVGFDRQSNDTLEVRLPGVDTSYGDLERLTLGYEGVAFTPWRALGFRFAVFGALSFATVGSHGDSFLSSRYYTSIGFGFRFHNDRLVFGAYEVRFSFFPSLPPGASSTVFDFTDIDRYQGGNFVAEPPATVPFD